MSDQLNMVAARIIGVASALALALSTSAGDAGAGPVLHASVADVVLLVMIGGAIVGAAILAVRAWNEARYGPADPGEEPPPLVFPALSQRSDAGAATRPPLVAMPPADSAGAARAPGSTAAPSQTAPSRPVPGGDAGPEASARAARAAQPASQPSPPVSRPQPARRARSSAPGAGSAPPSPPNGRAVWADGEEEDLADVTLQLLPGRLEVVSGDAGLEEIRFIRGAAGESVVTLGRGSGSPPSHVQLRSPAVSRRHAQMRYRDGAWYVMNLSRTNPAVVNGEVLGGDGAEAAERVLRDGDQLELGDVVLRYRS